MKKFMVSVADVRLYDVDTQDLIAIGKTLVDSSLQTTLGNTDIRGGRGDQLQAIYYHTSDLNLTVNDTQFNLDFLATTVGKNIGTGANVYTEETVTLGGGGAGTVAGTPLAVTGTTIYGWVTLPGGTVEKVTFTGSNFTSSLGTSGQITCVRYYALNSGARSLTISADILPKIVRVEMETLLISSQETSSRIGVVQIIVPTGTLDGAFSLSMTASGVSTTPMKIRALANNDLTTAACSNDPVLAEIIEILDNATFYDNLVAISIQGGDISLLHTSTKQLIIWGIPQTGAAFVIPLTGTNVTFSSSVAGTATVGTNNGLITGVAINSSTPTIIHATITAKPALDASISVICT